MLAQWINAKFYISTYRPVPIDEYLVYENAIYPAATSRELFQTASKLTAAMSTSLHNTIPPQRLIDPSSFKELSNAATNAMVALAVETAAGGYGALVFCGSRQGCQIHAATISEAMPNPAETDELGKRLDLLAELRSLSCGLDPVLQTIIIKGTGFHRRYCLSPALPIIDWRCRCWHDNRRTGADRSRVRPRRATSPRSHMQSRGGCESPSQTSNYQRCKNGPGTGRPRNAATNVRTRRTQREGRRR